MTSTNIPTASEIKTALACQSYRLIIDVIAPSDLPDTAFVRAARILEKAAKRAVAAAQHETRGFNVLFSTHECGPIKGEFNKVEVKRVH